VFSNIQITKLFYNSQNTIAYSAQNNYIIPIILVCASSNGGGELIRDTWAESNLSRTDLLLSHFEEDLKALEGTNDGSFFAFL